MSINKAEITLIIVVMVIFGFFVLFVSEVFPTLLEDIGEKFSGMVDSVFKSTDAAIKEGGLTD